MEMERTSKCQYWPIVAGSMALSAPWTACGFFAKLLQKIFCQKNSAKQSSNKQSSKKQPAKKTDGVQSSNQNENNQKISIKWIKIEEDCHWSQRCTQNCTHWVLLRFSLRFLPHGVLGFVQYNADLFDSDPNRI